MQLSEKPGNLVHSMYSLFRGVSGVILAGGENRRMPVPKALIKVRGEKIIDRSVRILKRIFQDVSIVTDRPCDYVYLDVPLLGDIYNVRGPMTGILTALIASYSRWVFVMACDMPFADERLIRHVASRRAGFEAVLPVPGNMPQPLFACYSKSLIPAMERAVLGDRKALNGFLNTKRVQYVRDGEIREIDPGARSFINLNTPEDVESHVRHFAESNVAPDTVSPGIPVAR